MEKAPELNTSPIVHKEDKREPLYKGENPPSYYDGGATEEKATEMDQARQENKIADVKEKIESNMSKTPATESGLEELPAVEFEGENKVFNNFPEISDKVAGLINTIDGKGKGIKGFWGKFSGVAKDELEMARVGARKAITKNKYGEIPKYRAYQRAIEEGGQDLAWKFLVRLKNENSLDIKDGRIVESGIYGNESGISGSDKQ